MKYSVICAYGFPPSRYALPNVSLWPPHALVMLTANAVSPSSPHKTHAFLRNSRHSKAFFPGTGSCSLPPPLPPVRVGSIRRPPPSLPTRLCSQCLNDRGHPPPNPFCAVRTAARNRLPPVHVADNVSVSGNVPPPPLWKLDSQFHRRNLMPPFVLKCIVLSLPPPTFAKYPCSSLPPPSCMSWTPPSILWPKLRPPLRALVLRSLHSGLLPIPQLALRNTFSEDFLKAPRTVSKGKPSPRAVNSSSNPPLTKICVQPLTPFRTQEYPQ